MIYGLVDELLINRYLDYETYSKWSKIPGGGLVKSHGPSPSQEEEEGPPSGQHRITGCVAESAVGKQYKVWPVIWCWLW